MAFSTSRHRLFCVAFSGVLAAMVCAVGQARGQMTSAAEDPSTPLPDVAVATPATEPAAAPLPDNRPDGIEPRDFRGRGFFGGFRMNVPADMPSPEEWQQVSSFMKDHSPRRLAFITNMSDERRKSDMMINAARGFRNVQKAQENDLALATVVIQRIEAEDAVFGVLMDVRQAVREGGNPEKIHIISQDLHDKVTALTVIGFKERQMRIDQLQRTLDSLKSRLAADQKNRDSLIEDRVHSIMGGRRFNGPGEAAPGASGNEDPNARSLGMAPAPQ